MLCSGLASRDDLYMHFFGKHEGTKVIELGVVGFSEHIGKAHHDVGDCSWVFGPGPLGHIFRWICEYTHPGPALPKQHL